ncbi:MAG: hypothetical protein ACOY0T_20885 [Myxococcota bacterium]
MHTERRMKLAGLSYFARRLSLLGAAVIAVACGARSELSASDLSGDVSPNVPCKTGTFALRRANPTLMFVIDRSRSMMQTLPSNGRSRWEVLSNALHDTLPPVDASIEVGALLFPSHAGNASESCSVPGTPDLLPALHHVDALLALVNETGPEGSTPTADAITAAARALRSVRAAKSARALVLATDGGPDCNTSLNPSTCRCLDGARTCGARRCLDDVRTVQRIADAAALSLPTYVIGIQDGVSSVNASVLDAMADAGGRPQLGGSSRYYRATSQAELGTALARIRDQVGACTYLTSSVPNARGTISVTIDGSELPLDTTGSTGWNWIDRTNGELLLAAGPCSVTEGKAIEAHLTCASQ